MPPLSIMIKPASSLCNLRCRYCFYHDVSSSRQMPSFGIMTETTAGIIIKKALAFADGEPVSFAFQGGEPLIAGLTYFKYFLRKLKEENSKNSPVYLSVQTNGTLLTEEWAEFFSENSILIGLSLDGNFKSNTFRVDENGNNVFDKVIKAAEILTKHNVDFNILTVLTGRCADSIEEIYSFFKSRGFRYLQFIPCLRPFGDTAESELYMTGRQYGDFLIRCFKHYVKDYMSGQYTSIRYFDNLVQLFRGGNPEQCGLCGHCMYQFVAEGNGNIYPCDFYCTDDRLLGNIHEKDFSEIAHCERATEFLKESFKTEPRCKVCAYLPLCRGGGCKRTKQSADYCEAYKRFFDECLPLFQVFLN